MANQLIVNYLSDTSIPADTRKNIAQGLNNGDLSEAAAVHGITGKYGEKYGKADAHLPPSPVLENLKTMGVNALKGALNMPKTLANAPEAVAGALIDNAPAIVNAVKSMPDSTPEMSAQRKATDEAAQQETQKKAAATQRLNSMGILPPADIKGPDKNFPLMGSRQTTASEVEQAANVAASSTPLGAVFETMRPGVEHAAQGAGDVLQSVNPLNADDASTRALNAAKGTERMIGGGLQAAFGPVTAGIEKLPYGKEVNQTIGGALGAVSGGTSRTFKDSMRSAGVNLTPEQEQVIDEGFSNLTNLVMMKAGSDVAKFKAGEGAKAGAYGDYAKATDIAGKESAVSALEKGIQNQPTMTGNFLGNAAEGAKTFAAPVAKGVAEVAAAGAKGVGKATGAITQSGLSAVSGLNPETISTAAETPKMLGEAQKAGVEATRLSTLEKLKSPIDKKISELKTNGKAYDPIRKSETAIVPPTDWLKNKIESAKLIIDDKGKIKATSGSLVRDSADIAKLQNIYDMYGYKDTLTANDFLNLRADLAGKKLAKFGSGVTTDLTNFAKGLRKDLNTEMRPQLPGLKELDTKFSSTIGELQKIKDLIYDKKGNLKDNAISTVNNLLGKGKEGKLAKIQQALPDFNMEEFAQQIKVTKALEDIEFSAGNKVGNYTKAILKGGAGFMAGGVPGAILAEILTQPKLIISAVKNFGKVTGKSSKYINSITNDILNGIKPQGPEATLVKNALLIQANTKEKY